MVPHLLQGGKSNAGDEYMVTRTLLVLALVFAPFSARANFVTGQSLHEWLVEADAPHASALAVLGSTKGIRSVTASRSATLRTASNPLRCSNR